MEFMGGRFLVAEQVPLFDKSRYFGWYGGLPTDLAALNLSQDIAGEDIHNRGIEAHDRSNITAFHEVSVKIPQIKRDLQIGRIDPDICR